MHLSKAELKYLRSLSQKKVRAEEKKFLVEGWRAVKDALDSSFEIELLATTPEFQDHHDSGPILNQAKGRKIPLWEINDIELNQISDTVHAQGIVALVRQKQQPLDSILKKSSHLVVVADAVSDPGNAGSIVRTSDWFGADAVLFGNGSVEIYNEKVVRSTAGSVFHLPVIESPDLFADIRNLKTKGFNVVATAGDGTTSLNDFTPPPKTAIVFGSEAHGISKQVRDAADNVLKIPGYGRAESLNVGVACGIVLAHMRNKRA